MGKTQDHLGNVFESIREKCEYWGVSNSLYAHRIKKGYTEEEALKGKSTVYDSDGIEYKNQKEMCKAHGISTSLYRARVEKGITGDRLFKKGRVSVDKEVIYDHLGQSFDSINQMCNAWHISKNTYNQRIRNGWSIADALTVPVAKSNKVSTVYDHLGNKFNSTKDKCKYYKINYPTYLNRIKMGWSEERALTQEIIKK